MKRMVNSVGILAYGSLIKDPGCEIKAVISCKPKGVRTPFKVEFARKSSTRGDAPTLVPVKQGGASVKAVILVLEEQVSVDQAKDMLYRREIHQVCGKQSYNPCNPSLCIRELRQFQDIGIVLYASFRPNISKDELTPSSLAYKAIKSVGKAKKGQDGISYLITAKSDGIRTPLAQEYEKEIKRQTKTESLEEALGKLQSSPLKDEY
jgi:cation transport regulator ChaC